MNIFKYLAVAVKDEINAIKEQFKESKLILVAFVSVVVGLGFYLQPFPEKSVVLSSSYQTSDWYQFGNSLAANLEKYGLSARVDPSQGTRENIDRLLDPENDTNVALGYAIALNEEERSLIVSLGSIDYEPVWVFYWKDKFPSVKSPNDLTSKKVGLGPVKSGSYVIGKIIFEASGVDVEDFFLAQDLSKTADDFLLGKLGSMAIVASPSNRIVQKLIRTEGVGVLDFGNAAAFEKRFNSLEALTLPMGSIDISKNIPSRDLSLIGTTTSVFVRPDTHPDMQLAILMAMRDFNRESKSLFFAKRNEFPEYIDPLVPISGTASKFYDYGVPPAVRYLPFWMAGFVDRAWVLFLALAALFYPLSKLNIKMRKIRFDIHKRPCYEKLIKIEGEIAKSDHISMEDRKYFLDTLDQIHRSVVGMGVPVGGEKDHFDFVKTISFLKEKLNSKSSS